MTNPTMASLIALGPRLELAWRDVDSSFERFCLMAGIGAMEQMLCEDAQQLTGPRHGRGGERSGQRWGATKGKIGFFSDAGNDEDPEAQQYSIGTLAKIDAALEQKGRLLSGIVYSPPPTRRNKKGMRNMVERYRSTLFRPGHKKGGRPKGVRNKMTTELKEAILQAAERAGDQGKGGMVAYLAKIARTRPDLFVRLLEKVLPLQVTGRNGGPLQVIALPPEVLRHLSDDELAVLEAVFERIAANPILELPGPSHGLQGDAAAYAEVIEADETRH